MLLRKAYKVYALFSKWNPNSYIRTEAEPSFIQQYKMQLEVTKLVIFSDRDNARGES